MPSVSRTDFEFNTRNAENNLNSLIAKIYTFENLTNNLGKTISLGSSANLRKEVDDLAKLTINAEKEKVAFTKSANADILRIERENAKARLEIEKQLTKQFNAEQTLRVNDAKRANNEAIRELNQRKSAPTSSGLDIGSLALGASAIGLSSVAITSFSKEALNANKEAFNSQSQLKAIAIETGLAYEKLSQQAKAFGDQTLLSNRQAESTFAQLASFANAAGRSDKLELFRQRFVDLASAKGINASQLGDISRQLNALTDEATDKLLNANPSAFYDKFAQGLGKTAEKLTDAEKRASIFDEVIRKGALFDGFAEKRLNDASSATDKLSRSWENLKEKIGGALVPLVDFLAKGGQLDFTSEAEREERRRNQGILSQQKAIEDASTLRSSDSDINNAKLNPFASAKNFALSNVNLSSGFNDVSQREKAIKQATDDANKFIADLQKRLENAPSNLGGNKDLLRIAQREFDKYQNLFGNETREKIRKSLVDGIASGSKDGVSKALVETEKLNKSIQDGKEKVKELGKTYNDIFSNLSAKSNSDNPFVSVFSNAEKSMRSLREQTRGLSDDLRQTFENLQRQQDATELFETRLDANLSAFDLQSEAERFRNARNPLADKEQFEAIVNRSINGLGSNSTGDLYRKSFGSDLASRFGANNLTDAQKRQIYEVSLLTGSTSGVNQDSLISAIVRQRLSGNQDLSVQDRLEKQFDIVRNLGASDDAQKAIADRKIIELTSGLNPSDLSQSQRDFAAQVREREAERRLNAENEAKKQRQEDLEIQKQIRDELKKFNSIAEKDGIKAILEIIDKTNGSISVREGRALTANDTANQYE